MLSTLTVLGTLPPERVPTFWERLIDRICPPAPLTPQEQDTERMRQETERLRQQALEADKNLFTAAAIKASEEAALIKIQRKEISDRIEREQAERDKLQKADEQLRIKFTARQSFQRGKVDGHTIVLTLGESHSGRRAIISWRVIDPQGTNQPVNESTQEFFRARPMYTNIILPWIHGEIATDDVKNSEYATMEGNTRIDFPLTRPKAKK